MCYINTLKEEELSAAKTYEHNLIDETSVVDRHRCDMAAKFGVFVDDDRSKLLTLYWLPKLHKRPYKSNKVAKIRNRYNQVQHLTQDTNGKVTNSKKTPQTRAKRSALSQQVTTKHI